MKLAEFVKTAILEARWEAEEQATAEVYSRQPDSPNTIFDPAVWESVALTLTDSTFVSDGPPQRK
ncbi:MAG: hypothetical protein ABJC13_08505 [Acidobacteriota bacterium]